MLKGYVDRADEKSIAGWAWDPEQPDRRIHLQICDGGDVICEVRADLMRADLARADIGDGRYGFAIQLPPNLLLSPVHLLHVRFKETGGDLVRSPQWVYTSHGGVEGALEEWFGRQVEKCTRAATDPAHLAPLISLCASALGRLLNAEERLRQGCASLPVASVARSALPARLKMALEQALEQCPPLHVPVHARPGLSIVVVGSPQFRDSYNCIRSIVASRGLRDYEIVFVNVTGTTDVAIAPLVIGGGIRFVSTPRPAAALAAYRMGLSLSRGERLLFLGHVVSVAPDAIVALSETIDALERPALVAPRLIGRDGRLIEAGAVLGPLAARQPVGQLELATASRYRVLRESDDVPSQAFMVDRTTLDSVGGFEGLDEVGEFGMADIALRLKQAHGSVVVQGFADVVVSGEALLGPAIDNRGRRNFVARWHSVLPPVSVEVVSPRRPRALIVDERLPDPNRDAASSAMLSHGQALVDVGFQVEFVPIDPDLSRHDDGRSLFVRGIEAHLAAEGAEALLRARSGQFDLIYLHRLSVAHRLISVCRETQPRAKLVYSVADLHGLRVQRHAKILGDEALQKEGEVLEEAERRCLAASDVAVTHSTHEAHWIQREVPGLNVVRALWSYRVNPAPAPYIDRSDFAFIGSYLHAPNIDSVRHFLSAQWPQLHDRSGGAGFEIAGSHLELGDFDAVAGRVLLRGHVADVRAYLSRIRVMLAPLRFGAGVKGKVLLSLAEGVPCIMTETAAEGIDFPQEIRNELIAQDDSDFIEKATRIYNDGLLWSSVSRSVHEWANHNVNQSAISAIFRTLT